MLTGDELKAHLEKHGYRVYEVVEPVAFVVFTNKPEEAREYFNTLAEADRTRVIFKLYKESKVGKILGFLRKRKLTCL